MELAVFLDIPDHFKAEATYAVENIFFPYRVKIIFVEPIEAFVRSQWKLIYCFEHSSNLNNPSVPADTLFILLEERTLDYFSSFTPYDPNNIQRIEEAACLFPLAPSKRKPVAGNLFPFDVISASFFFLSCWQDYTISEKDTKGRIPFAKSIQGRIGNIRKPVVNQYMKLLTDRMRAVWGLDLEKKNMPRGGRAFMALSHDVDQVDWPQKRYIRSILQNRKGLRWDLDNILSIFRNLYDRKYIFRAIRSMELQHFAGSTYYFFSNYDPPEHDRFAKNLIDSLDGTTFEVGHHVLPDSLYNGQFEQASAALKRRVRKVLGARVHELRFEVNSLFRQLEICGYKYDNSLMFIEALGYRTGFSYPHYIFDPIRRRAFDIVAIPLNIMDVTVFDGKYNSIPEDSVEDEIISFLKSAIPYGGAVSMLIHNGIFYRNTAHRLTVLENILGYLRTENIPIGPCRELYFWRKQ